MTLHLNSDFADYNKTSKKTARFQVKKNNAPMRIFTQKMVTSQVNALKMKYYPACLKIIIFFPGSRAL